RKTRPLWDDPKASACLTETSAAGAYLTQAAVSRIAAKPSPPTGGFDDRYDSSYVRPASKLPTSVTVLPLNVHLSRGIVAGGPLAPSRTVSVFCGLEGSVALYGARSLTCVVALAAFGVNIACAIPVTPTAGGTS